MSLVTFHAKRTLQDNPGIRQRAKRKQKKEEERVDDNPVYALYEVHDDPVAEVRTLYTISRRINPGFSPSGNRPEL